MKNKTIFSITLMPDHPDYLTPWMVGDNCDEIRFRIISGAVWYQPICDGVPQGVYYADQIEKVYYFDKTVEKISGGKN